MDAIEKRLLHEVADLDALPVGAYNIRENGKLGGRSTTANIDIVTKSDKPGIDIIIKPGTVGESVHIPVILSQSGLRDMVYNDFYIGENCDVVIIAGCGIHNDSHDASEHDGIHRFYLGQNSRVRYPYLLCCTRRARKICRKALRRGQRKRKEANEPHHCRSHCRGRLHGNGDHADIRH